MIRTIKKVLSFLLNRWVVSVIGLLLLALLIWLLGPHIAIAGYPPLDDEITRIFTIAVVILLWSLNALRVVLRDRKANREIIEQLTADAFGAPEPDPTDAASAEELETIRQRFRDALATLKKAKLGGRRGRRLLYQFPWYLVIGPPGAGKSATLINSGLKFPLVEEYDRGAIRGVGGTRNCDWWFTEEAILLDTAGRYTTQDSDEEVDRAAWQGVLELLRTHRRRRPIDGVIVAISVTDLLFGNPADLERQALAIRSRLQELYASLKVKPPIYMLITKSDFIAGFCEFFGDMLAEERDQVWGVTFPIGVSREADRAVQAFGAEFDALVERLNGRVMDRLDRERDSVRSGLIFTFPQQLAVIRGAILEFLGDAFGSSRYEEDNFLRGVYFTSATQEGCPVNRLIGSVCRAFGLKQSAAPVFSGPGRSYFLGGLFRDVIFQEAEVVGPTSILERYRPWFLRAVYGGVAVMTLMLVVAWSASYARNRTYVAEFNNSFKALREETSALDYRHAEMAGLLSSLSELRSLSGNYADSDRSIPLLAGLGLYQGDKLGGAAYAAYRKALNVFLLPRIIDRLEQSIQENADNPGALYESLRTYLMLGIPSRLEPDVVRTAVTQDWVKLYPGVDNAPIRKRLESHLSALLESDIKEPRLDTDLVQQAQARLRLLPIADRIYEQVKTAGHAAYAKDWRIDDEVSADHLRFFRRKSNKAFSVGVPAFFTVAGYAEVFRPERDRQTDELLKDAWVLGPDYARALNESTDTLSLWRQVSEKYVVDYMRTWDEFIADFEIIPFHGQLALASEVVKELSARESPIKSMIMAFTTQTALYDPPKRGVIGEKFGGLKNIVEDWIGRDREKPVRREMDDPAILVDQHYERLNALVEEKDGQLPIDAVFAPLGELYVYLESMKLAASRGEDVLKNTANRGIVDKIQIEARRQPAPLGPWLSSLIGRVNQILGKEKPSSGY
jgi:type VI secretion system protein ImpL